MKVKCENGKYVIQTNDYAILISDDIKFNLYKLAHNIDGDAELICDCVCHCKLSQQTH
jgi:hypothetical protein